MTREELAKKKGLKLKQEEKTPAESLITTIAAPIVEKVVETPVPKPISKPKRSVGKPKKRKDGDKKMSFWIDADLVDKIYSNLKYGDTINDFINNALREYVGRI